MNVIHASELTPELAKKGCFVLFMPEQAYHNYPLGVSKSQLDKLDRSPAHLMFSSPTQPTRAMEIGSAIHCAILEPERFERDYLVVKGINDRRKTEFKEALKHHDSSLVLTQNEGEKVEGMQSAIQANNQAMEILKAKGMTEVSAFVECPETGVQLRCRFDYLAHSGIALDLKKTQDVRYDKFQRSIANYRYHVQDAFYSYVYKLITGLDLDRFVFLAVEEEQPHANKLYELDTEAKQVGHRAMMDNLKTYAECNESDDWSGVVHESELISLPMWALDDEEVEL